MSLDIGAILERFHWKNPKVEITNLGLLPSNKTARKMKEMIDVGSKTPYVRYWAEMIVEEVPTRHEVGEVENVFKFLQGATRYAKDPKGFEYIQTPQHILERVERGEIPSLDCDDHTVLSLALLRTLGYPVKIRVVGFDKSKPYSHVYGLVQIYNAWVPFDAVRRDKELGWESNRVVKKFDLCV